MRTTPESELDGRPRAPLSLTTRTQVEEAMMNSRAKVFAVDEDIKMCQAEIIHNAATPVLVEAALQREKGSYMTETGALSVRSGAKTGRSPKDKRVVAEPNSVDNVWWGPVNIKMSLDAFMINRERTSMPCSISMPVDSKHNAASADCSQTSLLKIGIRASQLMKP